jgi:hypothetical protein
MEDDNDVGGDDDVDWCCVHAAAAAARTLLYSGPLHDLPHCTVRISRGDQARGTASFGGIHPSCPPIDWSITAAMNL